MNPILDQVFSSPYSKPILEDGSIDTGILTFSRPYHFSISGGLNYSTTSINYFVHTFDNNIYPLSLTTATGFSTYSTSSNSYSGYYHMAMMKLFNLRIINDYRGIYSITSVTSSTTSALYNSGKFDPSKYLGTNIVSSSFTAAITSIYYYRFSRNVIGDRILDGTLNIFNNNTLIASEPFEAKNSSVLVLTSSIYNNQSSTSLTQFWVLPDTGEMIFWSSDSTIHKALTAVNNIQFQNSVCVGNITINALIQPQEFNNSLNPSFYQKTFNDGTIPDVCFSTIIFYNPWGQPLFTAKIPRALRKSNIPINFKIILDVI